jgi:radical SAM family uncharacterized protein/radical SAM-linked protein
MEKNSDLRQTIEALLPRVAKPHRYLGNELNTVLKPRESVTTRVALVFPEVYEIGMSWPGQQILYHLLNGKDGVQAERAYAVWPDMEAGMRARGVPAFSLESWTPLGDFDILGFTLQYELVFTNILTILDLAGLPLRSRERRREDPLILAGGPVAYNAEPIADFLDAVVLGDGEDVFLEICDVHREWKNSGADRDALLGRLARIPGVYVPTFYTVEYEAEPVAGWSIPAIRAVTPLNGAPAQVRRRWVEDLNRVPFPDRPIVALGKTVHSRLGIEVQRGCTRACRFCQAGYIYRPERQRDPEKVKQLVADSLKTTGYDEVSLLSLSIGDYGCLDSLLGDLLGPDPRGTSNLSVSLPSIRADTLQEGIVDKVASARKTGFTIAPEAGSPRLRDIINKALSEEEIARAAELVFQRGWTHIKFYYMIGLPTETDDDVMGIVRTARMCQKIGRNYRRNADIIVSTSTFIPKPFTPFQWEPQIPRDEILRKQRLLRDELRKTRLTYRCHESRESFLEAVVSRGDRRLADVIETAFRKGARFDGWNEHFQEDVWREAFAAHGIEPGFYAHRRVPVEETLAWDHIDCGITKEWLIKDYHNGVKGRFVPDCATGRCYDCGVCDWEVIMNRTYVSKETGYYPQGQSPRGKGEHPRAIETVDKPRLADLLPPAPKVEDSEIRRFRIRFAKEARAAYLGHLDLMENLARAFKRAGLRVAYSQGHHPKPRMAFGPALMTGATSCWEYFDVDLMPPFAEDGILEAVNEGLPAGLALLEATRIPRNEPSIGISIRGAEFEITERLPGILPGRQEREEAVARFRSAPAALVTTPKKTYDVRPHVVAAEVTNAGFRLSISIAQDTGSARPTDVIRAILGWEDSDDARLAGLAVAKTIAWFKDEPTPPVHARQSPVQAKSNSVS